MKLFRHECRTPRFLNFVGTTHFVTCDVLSHACTQQWLWLLELVDFSTREHEIRQIFVVVLIDSQFTIA